MTSEVPFVVVPIAPHHNLSKFDCGQVELNTWLRERSWPNETNHASRTFVALTQDDEVAGYYSLSNGVVERSVAHGFLRRNMPDPIPVLVLGRLAVDLRFQAHGLGRILVGDSLLRTLRVSKDSGVRCLIVHALTVDVIGFYERLGFRPYRDDPRDLALPVADIERSLE